MTPRILKKKIKITGKLEVVTGIRIGDSKESTEIGGVDSPVVRRKDNNQPYLPGSSIKGKMRCLLELVHGENGDSKSKQTGSIICQLFGAANSSSNSEDGNQSRIIVRDAYLTDDSAKKLAESPFTDMPFTEIKAENSINRIKGTAEAPRFFERVPAGAEFNIEFIINIFEGDDENALLQTFKNGIKLLENDYLGGSGSRGYGQVKVHLNPQQEIRASDFKIPASDFTVKA
jgi:CRISPR-associated protein Csm3